MNFRQVRTKIRSIGNVRKITKAMQMVAAVKMRKAQATALEGRLYREILEGIIKRIVQPGDTLLISDNQKTQTGLLDLIKGNVKVGRNLYILISSNKGLNGSFNTNLFRFAFQKIDFEKSEFIVLGKKGADFLAKTGGAVLADFSNQIPFIDNVSAVLTLVLENYVQLKYDTVFIVHNKFISSFNREATVTQLLPIVELTNDKQKNELETVKKYSAEYVIEPSREELMRSLIRDFLERKIRTAILDSEASEHSARMLAMKNATDNAGDIIYNLTLLRNKLRQEKITYELLDMISATSSSEA